MQHGVKMTDSMNLSQEDHDTSSERQEGRLTACCCAHLCSLRGVVIVRVIVDGVYLVS